MPSIGAPVAQLDRALPSEGRGRRFDSCRAHHTRVAPITGDDEIGLTPPTPATRVAPAVTALVPEGGGSPGMFTRIAPVYDRLNRVLSLGLDQGWRRATAAALGEDARVVLDLCAGTGDLARILLRPGRTVFACDGSHRMQVVGATRHPRRAATLHSLTSDAYRLPLPDASLDGITIAFGLRNLHRTDDALREMHRVLRRGGRLAILELAPPPPHGLRAVAQRLFVGRLVPQLARLFTRDVDAYAYLSASVLGYKDEVTLSAHLAGAGLTVHSARRLGFGAVQLLVAEKT